MVVEGGGLGFGVVVEVEVEVEDEVVDLVGVDVGFGEYVVGFVVFEKDVVGLF